MKIVIGHAIEYIPAGARLELDPERGLVSIYRPDHHPVAMPICTCGVALDLHDEWGCGDWKLRPATAEDE